MVQACLQAWWGANGVAGTKGGVGYSSLELVQILPLDMLPNCTITLTLSNSKISEMKNGLVSWVKPSRKTSMMVVSMVGAGTRGPPRLC